MLFWEDMEVGEIDRFGNKTVTREEMLDFAEKYDPQPFHLSDNAAAMTHFGKLAASGWHTAAMTMRMIVDRLVERQVASLGSPGVDGLKFLRPVFADDVLRVESEMLDKRASKSRPEMGLSTMRTRVFNQDDEEVMRYDATVMTARRPSAND